MKWCLVKVQG